MTGSPHASDEGRAATITRLDNLDLLIIGGGIVGAGIARDAALRGLRVGLVEQHDFASGTSSRSSRLLHGGLRYLAQGRVGLVREASHEKRVINRIAPHLAEPMPFLFPTYAGGWNDQWARWKLGIGVKVYDLLCGGRNLGASESLSPDQVSQLAPGLDRRHLTGGVRYFDGFTNDARLVLDTLRSASRAGASLVNYCRFENAEFSSGSWRCTLSDELSHRELEITARTVVNAAGPWAAEIPHSRIRLRLTKGVHLIVDRTRLPVPSAVVMTDQSRILFVIPWGERVILGTTDTDYEGRPEEVTTRPDDILYILGVTNRHFPGAGLTQDDVISDYAGLRPLIADSNGNPSDISRSHQIASPQRGWWDVSGGKLTTYRLMAEQTIDRIMHHLGRRGTCTTADVPLLPDGRSDAISGILPPPVTSEVAAHFCRNEWAVHLEDVMIRRTSWHYYHRNRDHVAEQISEWMANALGWTEAQRQLEIRQYMKQHSSPAGLHTERLLGEPAA